MPTTRPIILIADDRQEIRESLGETFSSAGYDVFLAENGQEAWRLLRQTSKVDIVLSDYDMPIVDGLELLRRVRSDERLKSLPFVLTSGDVIVSEEDPIPLFDVCRHFGAQFVPKPYWSYPTLIHQVLFGTLGKA